MSGLGVGDRVIDVDQPEGERSAARVVDDPGTKASDHRIAAIGKTVAEANPDHPPEASVVAIQFEDDDGDLSGATYHYPATRLKPVSEEWDAPETVSKGRRERERIYGGHDENVSTYIWVLRRLLRHPARNADQIAAIARTIDLSPETRGGCRYTKDDTFRPEDRGAIVCWECNDGGRRPAKYQIDDSAGSTCEIGKVDQEVVEGLLAEWIEINQGGESPTLAADDYDLRDLRRDLHRLRSADDDSIRRGAIRIAYRLSLGGIEEYHHGRARALLRDRGVASELPIIGDGEGQQ
jgi:hypothetical protein